MYSFYRSPQGAKKQKLYPILGKTFLAKAYLSKEYGKPNLLTQGLQYLSMVSVNFETSVFGRDA